MKKLISGLSALAIAAALAPMSAFAENETGGSTNVTFDAPRNSPEYMITIPAKADLNAENPKATIKAENVYLDTTKHKQINVTLDSAQYVETGASEFIAKTEDGSSSVTYTIGKGDATTGVKVGDTVAEFTEDGNQVLSFSAPTGATYAGTHTETLTFGISVESAVTTRTVTWNASDITNARTSFTKDGITITAKMIDDEDKNFAGPGTFTTESGKFTKIEVTAAYVDISDTGWSGSNTTKTWTGDASSSVSYSDDIYDMGHGQLKIVFTIEE